MTIWEIADALAHLLTILLHYVDGLLLSLWYDAFDDKGPPPPPEEQS